MPGYYKDADKVTCKANDVISNCLIWNNKTTCGKCVKGFALVNGTTCTQATASNCLRGDGANLAKCKLCEDGFYLDFTLKTCVTWTNPPAGCKQGYEEASSIVKPVRCLRCDDGLGDEYALAALSAADAAKVDFTKYFRSPSKRANEGGQYTNHCVKRGMTKKTNFSFRMRL